MIPGVILLIENLILPGEYLRCRYLHDLGDFFCSNHGHLPPISEFY